MPFDYWMQRFRPSQSPVPCAANSPSPTMCYAAIDYSPARSHVRARGSQDFLEVQPAQGGFFECSGALHNDVRAIDMTDALSLNPGSSLLWTIVELSKFPSPSWRPCSPLRSKVGSFWCMRAEDPAGGGLLQRPGISPPFGF